MIRLTDIVKFNDKVQCEAAKWCFKHKITGEVIDFENGILKIKTGLCYPIWVPVSHVDLIATQSEAPIPDDIGTG